MIDLRNPINSKETPKNENPNKIINIVEKILDFNKQEKGTARPLDLATRLKIFFFQINVSKITNSTCTSKSR